MAVLEALNTYDVLMIYSDCQAVVQQMQQIQKEPHQIQHKKGAQYKAPWEAIQNHIRRRALDDVRIQTAKAHQDLTKIAEPLQRWAARGNNAADQQAKQAIHQDAASILQQRNQSAERQKTALEDLINNHNYLVDIQTEVLKVEQAQKKKRGYRRAPVHK